MSSCGRQARPAPAAGPRRKRGKTRDRSRRAGRCRARAGADLSRPRRPRLPRAGRRVQGHRAAARPTTLAFARWSTRWPRRAATLDGDVVVDKVVGHRGPRLHPGRAGRARARRRASCRSARRASCPATTLQRVVRARVRRGDPGDPRRTPSRPATASWSSTTCSPPAARSRRRRTLDRARRSAGRGGRRADRAGLPAGRDRLGRAALTSLAHASDRP